MVHFTTFVFSAWVALASAQESDIAGYSPITIVTDYNAFDRDQLFMEDQLELKTPTSFANARAIYEDGGNSQSIAVITLAADLGTTLPAGTEIAGRSNFGGMARGILHADAAAGQKTVIMRYGTSQYQATWVMCRVGGLVEGIETSGCLKNEGTVTINGGDFAYSYDGLINNDNGRTFKSISTDVQSKMLDCPGCPFADAKMFNDYYGTPDYADQWVTAAFNKGATTFTNGNGDFSLWKDSDDALGEIIKKGTLCMSVFMTIIRKFEESVVHCTTECTSDSCKNDAVAAWDAGVALYTGSIEETDGNAGGFFLHQMADTRCGNFKTCGENGGLMGGVKSYINSKLLRLFVAGQEQVVADSCVSAKATVESIAKHMYIPIIQGALRYAWVVDEISQGPKVKAEGAAFVAAVLPRVHAISPPAAKVIYDNMRVGAESTSFSAVKNAFESIYPGLGITCAKVGGLVNSDGEYKDTVTKPCVDGQTVLIVDNDDDDGKPKPVGGDNSGAGDYTWSAKTFMFTAFAATVVFL